MKLFPRLFIFSLGIGIFLSCVGSLAIAQVKPRSPLRQARVISPPVNRRLPLTSPSPPFQTLTRDQQDYVDWILLYWEKSSDRINTFSCKFTRWEYTPFVKKHAATRASGTIKFRKPDQGLYRVEKIGNHTPPKTPGAKPTYPQKPGYEHWVCDGKTIFEFNYLQKQLTEIPVPVELQGKAIQNGPLPFLFGAKKKDLKNRYWIRWVPPPQGIKPGEELTEYWLEAYPKTKQDKANYEKLVIVLAKKDFLPKSLQIILPGGTESKSFNFEDRRVNKVNDRLRFLNDFAKPKLPRGWTLEKQKPAPPRATAQRVPPRQNAQPNRR